ncbi:hypothetical protein ACOZFM_00885 [Streptomyces arboris]|uniref:hypothetical protein n=1 Tax=Streptomyces arboris TaxID=2600619 RepID=UPI003BF5674C
MGLLRVRAAAAPTLIAVLLLTAGCAGDASDGDTAAGGTTAGSGRTPTPAPPEEKSDAADPKQAAYFACIAERGVPMRDTGSGVPVVDEAKADPAEVERAENACADKLAVPDADAEALALAREFTQCMRENGVEDFPDPNPRTGAHDGVEGLGLKGSPEGMAAMKKCHVANPGTDGKVGG